MNENMLKISLW